MMRIALMFFFLYFLTSCGSENVSSEANKKVVPAYELSNLRLDIKQANRLSKLPMNCIQTPLPYKAGHVLVQASDLDMPINHHPAFYGCFDWHSAVHGHWSLVYLLKRFDALDDKEKIKSMLRQNLSKENIEKEVAYFTLNKYTKNFERTYGWTWVLKLAEELYTWEDPLGQELYKNLQPLCDYITQKYIEYLPKLVYPIRVGEHSNTAFGISFAYDYSKTVGKKSLQEMIEKRANDFYTSDQGCPISWEPSGYDFLSPCLEEAYIMSRVLNGEQFNDWFEKFLPGLKEGTLELEPAKVSDRSDGKLVHLDGLNFSRAWCLYSIAQKVEQKDQLYKLADEHLDFSLKNIVDGDYMGEHWLASFALYAMKSKAELE